MNVSTISQNMKNTSWLSIEKIIIELTLYHNYKKLLEIIKNHIFLIKNNLESSFDEEYKHVLKNQF